MAYSLDFPEEENFHESVKGGMRHFAAIIHMLFKNRLDMPGVGNNEIASAHKQFEGVLHYFDGDEATDLELDACILNRYC